MIVVLELVGTTAMLSNETSHWHWNKKVHVSVV